ncbi:MAG: hypothetical protein QOH81_2042 [Sphingomonadales bacterium]|nr:hypothetical protein [Sphingomonadales bacterium]
MPRYFFHIYDEVFVRDDEGMELTDDDAARRAAMAGIREMVCEQVKKGRLVLHHRLEVEDAAGAPVMSLAYGDAVAVEP